MYLSRDGGANGSSNLSGDVKANQASPAVESFAYLLSVANYDIFGKNLEKAFYSWLFMKEDRRHLSLLLILLLGLVSKLLLSSRMSRHYLYGFSGR